MTSDAVSKVLHLIDVPSSVDIEEARSFCDVAEPGVNVLSCLHADLPWINLLDGVRDVTILLNTDVMSVRMGNCHGGVATIDVRDIPIGAYVLGGVVPPRYSSLSINTFDAISQLISLKSISSLSIVLHKEARSILPYKTVGGFTGTEWCRLL